MALAGFNETYYLTAKLAQLGEKFDEWQGKSTDFLKDYLANVGMTPEQHYEKYGWSEDLNPNAYFNGYEYVEAKAQQLFDAGKYGSLADAKAAFEAAWTGNPYDHYLQYGGKEGVNPSNAFDNSAYLDEKVAALKAAGKTQEDGSEWTADALNDYLAANGLTPLTHYVEFGKDEGLTAPEVPADEKVDPEDPTPVNPGETYTLTTAIDAGAAFEGTSGNDTYIGTIGTGQTTQLADQIDGKAGTDLLKIYSDGTATTVLPQMTSIEGLYVKGVSTAAISNLDYAAVTDLKTIELDTGKTAAAAASTATYAAGQTLTLDSITDGDGTAEGANKGELQINSAATVDSVSLVLDGVGGTGNALGDDLDLEVLGTGVKAIDINSATNANVISLAVNGTSALETLTLTGDANLTITNAIDFKGTTSGTVVASSATGDLDLDLSTGEAITFTGGSGKNTVDTGAGDDNLTGGAKVDTFTIGAGNDTVSTLAGDDVIIAAGNLTKNDTIDGGDGEDTLVITDTTLNATTKAKAAGVSNVEVLGVSAGATADITVDYNALSSFDKVAITTSATAANVTATMENTDTLIVSAARVETNGGDAAIDLNPMVDGGSNVANLTIIGNSDITGSTGAIDANLIETLNIDIAGTLKTGTADTVTFADTVANTEVLLGTNAELVLTSSLNGEGTIYNNVDLGIVKGTNATIDGSAFKGDITAQAVDGNVTLKGGEGDDTLLGGTGKDSISGGAGDDTITGGVEADTIDLGTGRNVDVVASNDTTGSEVNDSSETTMDKVSNFNTISADIVGKDLSTAAKFLASTEGGAEADLLDLTLTTAAGAGQAVGIEADGTDANIEGSITGVAATVNGVVKDGILTLTGAGATDVDTLAEWVDAAGAVAADLGDVIAFEFDSNTYVFADNADEDLVVQLTGVTGVTGVGLADASTDATAGWILVG